MNPTLIEWVKNPDGSQGFTCNSKTGCLNHTLGGLCLGGKFPCYAFKLANGRLRERYLANKTLAPTDKMGWGVLAKALTDPFYPRFWPDRLEQIRQRKKPAGIFLDDMSDWMGEYWPEEWTRAEIQVMRGCPQHRFYTLTKQPQNLHKFSPFPDNCWVGVTATNGDMAHRALMYLDRIQATVRYLSIEPLLGRIMGDNPFGRPEWLKDTINWLIIGSQTKPYQPPQIDWVQEIVRAADHAGIPVFLKDNLGPLAGDPRHNFNLYNHFEPMNPILRQELPR